MADLQLTWGSDLTIDAYGDLATSDGTQEGQERVVRRLLTFPNEYIWHVTYGAGLARFLGRPAMKTRIAAITRSQLSQEASVARTPPAQITVNVQRDGTVTEDIKYSDGNTGAPIPLTLPITG